MIDQINPQTLAILTFIVTYFFIATGRRERAIAAIAGAAALWALGVLTGEEMVGFIDVNTLGLLFGMMVVVGGLREAGFFRWVGIHVTNLCGCKPLRMLLVFTLMTALLSAFLDNVTTVLFMIVVTIEIMETLKLNPKPFIICEMLASNIGGTTTLIGDPPNMLIASASGMTFTDFILNVAPIAAVSFIVAMIFLRNHYGRTMDKEIGFSRVPLEPKDAVRDRQLFNIGFIVFFTVTAALFLHDALHVSPSTIALLGAAVLLFVGGPKMPEVLKDVEWSTLIFLACLFIVVGSLEKTGVIHEMSMRLFPVLSGSQLLAVSVILWISAFAAAFMGAVPFTVAFIPMITDVSMAAGIDTLPFWWTLSLGVGLGGNGTIIGSAALIVASGIALKRGYVITFMEFLKIGMTTLLITTATANALLLLRMVIGI